MEGEAGASGRAGVVRRLEVEGAGMAETEMYVEGQAGVERTRAPLLADSEPVPEPGFLMKRPPEPGLGASRRVDSLANSSV